MSLTLLGIVSVQKEKDQFNRQYFSVEGFLGHSWGFQHLDDSSWQIQGSHKACISLQDSHLAYFKRISISGSGQRNCGIKKQSNSEAFTTPRWYTTWSSNNTEWPSCSGYNYTFPAHNCYYYIVHYIVTWIAILFAGWRLPANKNML